MEQRFTFTENADKVLTAPPQTKQAFGEHWARVRGSVPWDIQNAAATDLVREARALQFTSGKSYEECSRHLMAQNPWLAVATAAISDSPDRAARALGIEVES